MSDQTQQPDDPITNKEAEELSNWYNEQAANENLA